MDKKRGLLIVVVLFVIFASSAVVGIEEWIPPKEDMIDNEISNEFVWPYGYMKTSGDSTSTDGRVRFRNSVIQNNFCEDWDDEDNLFYVSSIPHTDYCGTEPCCVLQLVHYDDGGNDECSTAYSAGGTMLTHSGSNPTNIIADIEVGDGSYLPSSLTADKQFTSYICDDYVWKECNLETDGSFLDVAVYDIETNEIVYEAYFCVPVPSEAGYFYEWVTFDDPYADKDEDGVPIVFDCDDDDPNVFGNFTMYREDSPQPRAICGDGKPNTCGAIPDETDECDDDKDACIYNCLANGEICSWKDSSSQNKCCGDDGLDDLGEIINTEGGGYLCLNNNFAVGQGDVPNWGATIGDEETCSGEWCWISPSGAAAFEILTIKKVGEEPYDVVSNSQQWFACQENGDKTIPAPIYGGEEEGVPYAEVANRFYCYQEGNRWSWAECLGSYGEAVKGKNKDTIKGRYAGEGLYSLFMAEAVNGIKYGSIIEINTKQSSYEDFYGDSSFDFTGYDYLEFMVKFVQDEEGTAAEEIVLPASISLEIYGPLQGETPVLYYSGNVLGYTTNSPLFSAESWMHIKVPITGFKEVTQIKIQSEPEQNMIGLRNLYLSKEEETSLLCSGEDTRDYSSWITDLDQFEEGNPVTGEKLCKALYGENAWLEDECCGDGENEYSFGMTYGCWNSQTIAEDGTAMNVQFNVEHKEKEISVDYPEESFDVEVVFNGIDSRQVDINYGCPSQIDCDDFSISSNIECTLTFSDCIGRTENVPGETCTVKYQSRSKDTQRRWRMPSQKTINCQEEDCSTISCNAFSLAISEECKITSYDCTERGECTFNYYTRSIEGRREEWPPFPVSKEYACDASNFEDEVMVVNKISDVHLEFEKVFFVEETGGYYIFSEQSYSENFNGKIRLTDSPKIINEIEVNKNDLLNSFTDEPYGSFNLGANSNPKINIYFLNPLYPEDKLESITSNDLTKERTTFYIMAEVNENYQINKNEQEVTKTTRVEYTCNQEECLYPLPGLFPYTITNLYPELYDLYFVTGSQTEDETFIGAGPKTFNELGNLKVRNVAQQVVYDEAAFYGCQAASFVEDHLENNLAYCSVQGNKFCDYSSNSWSEEPLTEIGYAPLESSTETVDEFYDSVILRLKEAEISAAERNHTAIVFPTRNFISNADFADLEGWELMNREGQLLELPENTISLSQDQILRSARITVPENVSLQFSHNGSASFTITLVSKDGTRQTVTENNFATGNNSFLIIELSGGTVEEPFLQLVDEMGPGEYNYDPNYPQRTGAACCPENFCWNGYTCVEPMSPFEKLAEHVSTGRDYRCIDGEWEFLPVKWNWHASDWGFCSQQDQCFVLSSNLGGSDQYKVEDFYAGNFPICVNDGEYLFDNYCEAGNWTSRTKFVATKLLEVRDGDYSLYCTNPRDNLVNMEGKEAYLLGSEPIEAVSSLGLGEAISEQTTEISFACFSALSNAEGRELILDEENTCINNVCLLKNEDGLSFATTLNRPLDDSAESFLLSLNIPQNKLGEICSGEGLVKCDLSGTSLEGDLWYLPELQAVIYSKERISFTLSIGDRIIGFFKKLFGGEEELSAELKFVENAANFRDLYLLSKGERKVRAVKESLPGADQTLLAEYENFATPICDYVDESKLTLPVEAELLETLSGKDNVVCTVNGSVQKVEILEGIDFFWPQLTGKLRASEE